MFTFRIRCHDDTKLGNYTKNNKEGVKMGIFYIILNFFLDRNLLIKILIELYLFFLKRQGYWTKLIYSEIIGNSTYLNPLGGNQNSI